MDRLIKLAALATMPLLIQGCGSDATAEYQENELNYSIVHKSSSLANGDFTSKGHRILASQYNYEDELLNYSNDTPISIDFTKSKVLLVDMGQRGGGHRIEIENVIEHDNYVTVTVIFVSPGKGCLVPQSFFNPYQFIEIEAQKEIIIQEKLLQSDCN